MLAVVETHLSRIVDADALSAAKMVTSRETVQRQEAVVAAATPASSVASPVTFQENARKLASAAVVVTVAASNAARKATWLETARALRACKVDVEVVVVAVAAAEPATNATKKDTWPETAQKQEVTTTEALAVPTSDLGAMTMASEEEVVASTRVPTCKTMAGAHLLMTTQDGEIT